MAYIKHLTIHTSTHLSNSIEYVTDEQKTNEDSVTGVYCDPEQIIEEFEFGKSIHNKVNPKIKAHHYIQSFKPGEVNEKEANEIGIKFIERIAPGYQAVVITHNDKDHIHNHIILNSVNLHTGYMYKANRESYKNAKEESNELSREYGLSVIEPSKYSKGIDQATYRLAEKGESWKVKMLNAIDEAVAFSSSKSEFISYLEGYGYDVKYQNMNISLKDPNEQIKYIRLDTLAKQFGEEYSKENVEKKLGIYGGEEYGERSRGEHDRSYPEIKGEQFDGVSKNDNSNDGTKSRDDKTDEDNNNKSKKDSRGTGNNKKNVERERYEKWKSDQNNNIKQGTNLTHIDTELNHLSNALSKISNNKESNTDDNRTEIFKVILGIIMLFIKSRNTKNRKNRKFIKNNGKDIKLKTDFRIGNIEYDKFNMSPGDNKYMNLNITELKKIREGADFRYTGIIKNDKITIMVKEKDLDKLLNLVGRKFEKQYGNTTYKFLKNNSKELEFRVVDERILELLKNTDLKFACFKKDDKYNIVFNKDNNSNYLNIIKNNNKTITHEK